jgi:hypothetical protein
MTSTGRRASSVAAATRRRADCSPELPRHRGGLDAGRPEGERNLRPRPDRKRDVKRRERIATNVQAIFFRRRHQPRRPPLAKIRPGRPAPTIGPGTAAVTVAVKVGFPTLVRIKIPPLVGKRKPGLNKIFVVEVIGPIAVVRSYVANALFWVPKIAELNVRSMKSATELAKVLALEERTATVSVKVTGVPLFILRLTVPTFRN